MRIDSHTTAPLVDSSDGALLAAAGSGDSDAFQQLTEPLRREIHLHCYRMMGSLHDAEDLVQETLLRAWRRLDTFQGRSTFRAWLYRVATNACLNALDHKRREPPLATPARSANGFHSDVVPHLQPYPDVLLERSAAPDNESPTPEARYELRESVSLAFQVAVQLLPPRQRAVLILGDVLGFSAREIADLIGSSVASVNSALQRARGAVRHSGNGTPHRETNGAGQRLVERFVHAWERDDIDGLVSLLTDAAVLTMPPDALSLVGRAAIAEFFSTVPAGGRIDQIRLVPTAANGQPALAGYHLDPATGIYHAAAIIVLTVDGHAISALTAFPDPSLFGFFGLPSSR